MALLSPREIQSIKELEQLNREHPLISTMGLESGNYFFGYANERGVHGGYWAIYNKDLENYGVTIHKVDVGVDTGDILYQEKVKYDSKDNYFTYPIKQYLVAIPLIIKVIEKIYNGEQLTPYRRTDLQSQSRLWYHPTIFQYLYGLLVNQVK